MSSKILLLKPPFFTPWTPPLGIAILKAFLGQHGYQVTCADFNTDPELWGTHHTYFTALQHHENTSINDGYSKLWWILNAHLLAYLNGANHATCERMLDRIIPLYGVKYDSNVIKSLIPIVGKYFKRLEELVDRIDLTDWGIVGTSTYTTSLASSLFILRRVKQKYPHIMTVLGGGIFADDLAPDSYNFNTLLESCPYVDRIVMGEGELLFLKLLRGELDKRVISIADIEDTTLDLQESCTPDFSDLNLESYYHMTVEGGRSCPFQCKFCSETVQWGKYRKKPVDLLVRQAVDLVQKHGNNTFFMADSLMNPYIMDFSRELLEKKANILYDGYLRADKPVAERDRVKLWARSGLYRVRLGIESGSAHVLNLMGKRTSPDVMSEVLKSLASAGVRTTTYWVIGFPGETEQDFQETVRFVREHYRYIYEFEAHPFYYYPQGQVGSIQYESHSLYPDDVTEVIKFKRWEVSDCSPTREETYERHSRLSKFAAKFDLPNIYTMKDRYQAEGRWHCLYPLVAEVYKGTQVSRKQAQALSPALAAARGQPLAEGAFSLGAALCYGMLVKKRLDKKILTMAVDQLIKHNDVLQAHFQPGQHGPMPRADKDTIGKMISVHSCEGELENEMNSVERQIVERLLKETSPEPGMPLRIALVENEQPSSKLFLLVHRAVADGKSVTLFCEDLFRIYEQLSEGREVSLLPTRSPYTKPIDKLEVGGQAGLRQDGADGSNAPASNQIELEGGRIQSRLLSLGKYISREIFKTLPQCGLSPTEVLAGGFLKGLKNCAGEAIEAEIAVDSSLADAELQRTVGPLTRRVKLPLGLVKGNDLLGVYQLRSILQNAPRGVEKAPLPLNGANGRVLLNFEYWVDEPWLGGDEWIPQGFAVDGYGAKGEYLLEMAPVITGDGIAVHLMYRPGPVAEELVETMSGCLIQDIEMLLAHCECYGSTRQFCLAEFSGYAPISVLAEAAGSERGEPGEGWAWTRCELPGLALDGLQAAFQADLPDIVFAAYGVLLSRLSGRQDIVFLSSVCERALVPLRVHPSWNLHFSEFVRDVSHKRKQMSEHQLYAFHSLIWPWATESNVPDSIFDVGYIFHTLEGSKENSIEQVSSLCPTMDMGKSGLVLEVVDNGTGLDMRFWYRRDLLAQKTIDQWCLYLTSILEKVGKNPTLPLGYIVLSKKKR